MLSVLGDVTDLRERAWSLLQQARIDFEGRTVGVRASTDPSGPVLNYDQCFVRDFAVCAPAFLLRGESEVVKRFLLTVVHLQMRERTVEAFRPRRGLMPASFRPELDDSGREFLEGDYGEASIARVTPIDSVFWWLLTLRAYTKATGDTDLASREEVQEAIRLALDLLLEGSFELFPALLVPEGSFMIDRRMGVYGHPLEVQALFFAGLRTALEHLQGDGLSEPVELRLRNLAFHVQRFYWLDHPTLERLHRLDPDQYGDEVMNVFNVFEESIPSWVDGWLPEGGDGGYLTGNVGPGRMDFRFFTQGNLVAVFSGLATPEQRNAIMRLLEARWDDLVGAAPLRIAYPALEGAVWRELTGADRKNAPWCYHNGGWWPCLLWSFANAAVACDRSDLLERAVESAERRLDEDGWPEYYDGRCDPVPGERARQRQSWSMGGYIYARGCLEDPSVSELYCWHEDLDVIHPEEASGSAA